MRNDANCVEYQRSSARLDPITDYFQAWSLLANQFEQAIRGGLPVRNIVMRWSLWIIFVASLASPCWSNELSQDPASVAPVHLGDVKIIIHQATNANAVVAKLAFEVHEKAGAALADVPLEWNPVEFLDDAKLRCVQDDQAAPLSIGEDAKSDFILVVTNRGRLKKGERAEFSLSVPGPETFPPGIYTGELKFRFSAPDQLNVDVSGFIRIFVAVRGRRLVDFRFREATNRQVRFGNPADIDVVIDTIDCELDHGDFQFSQRPTASPAPQSLTLKLPFAENEFQDPKLVLKPSSYPSSWSKTAFWTDASVTAGELIVAKIPPAFCDWKRHTVTLHLWECNELGGIQGGIKWPQSKNAPGRNHRDLELTAKAEVLEGIKAFPRLAFRHESIELSLASRLDLGADARLILVDQEGANHAVQLKKSGIMAGDDGAKLQVGGQPHMYSGKFVSKKFGKFHVRFPADLVKQHAFLKALEDTSPEIQVWLARNDSTRPTARLRFEFLPARLLFGGVGLPIRSRAQVGGKPVRR